MDKKTLFLKMYANLPAGSRDEIIAVVEGETYTWRSAKLEIEQDTPLGAKILEHLETLGILHEQVS